MTGHNQSLRTLVPSRNPSAEERDLLQRPLAIDFPGVTELQAQAESCLVSAECTCGYRSILFSVTADAVPISLSAPVPVEASTYDADGTRTYILLHVVNGFLAELEVQREDAQPIQVEPDYSKIAPFPLA